MSSSSPETKDDVLLFDDNAYRRLSALDRELREGRFVFRPQVGLAIDRGRGKKRRPIVIAAIENRIVQRALLDHLSAQPRIAEILGTATSFGGIKKRGCKEAIGLAIERIRGGAKAFVRTDILGFFNAIPRMRVIDFIRENGVDPWIVDLLQAGTTTKLANLDALGEDASLFPTRETGVAQGSALSALFGNILLHDFDTQMNGRGITCIRYIDDLLFLGPTDHKTRKAFSSALGVLKSLGLEAYDPATSTAKAEAGPTDRGFDFLGRTIAKGLVFPSQKARVTFLASIDELLQRAKQSVKRAAATTTRAVRTSGVAQALTRLDHMIRGWANAHRFCTPDVHALESLEREIDERVVRFFGFIKRLSSKSPAGDTRTLRRIFGVHLLAQTQFEPLVSTTPQTKAAEARLGSDPQHDARA